MRVPRLGRPARWAIAAAACAVLVLAGIGAVLFAKWPFRQPQMEAFLGQSFQARVQMRNFHRIYLPHPGFVAEGVTLTREMPGGTPHAPLASLAWLKVEATWHDLFLLRYRVRQVQVQGLSVHLPGGPATPQTPASSGSKTVVESIVADGSTLDIARGGGAPPLHFDIRRLRLHNAGVAQTMQYDVSVKIPVLPGIVDSAGSLGPLHRSDPGRIMLAGSYALHQANLSAISGLGGELSANGHFGGELQSVYVTGEASVPALQIGHSNHARVDAKFAARVNGTSGETTLMRVSARTGNSTLEAVGSVSGKPYVTHLELTAQDAHIEDLLRLIVSDEPPVVGLTNLRANVVVPSGPDPFIRRLQTQGAIALEHGRFTNPRIRKALDAFSGRALTGKDADDIPPRDVGAQASSEVTIQAGVARFPSLAILLPGVWARLHGTYDLTNLRVDLSGQLAMKSSLPNVTTGWKSVLLKPLAPFFRRRHEGAVIPVSLTGRYPHPQVHADLWPDPDKDKGKRKSKEDGVKQ